MSRTGCYDIYITTPKGRDYHSSEFADLPRTPAVGRVHRKAHPADKLNSDFAHREIAQRFYSQAGTKRDLFDYRLLIRKLAHGRRYALPTACV